MHINTTNVDYCDRAFSNLGPNSAPSTLSVFGENGRYLEHCAMLKYGLELVDLGGSL